jgi:uncharacterized delta-60 repeat protein
MNRPRRVLTPFVIAFVASSIFAVTANAAPGDLDSSFGSGGLTQIVAPATHTFATQDLTIQGDGKFLVSGTLDSGSAQHTVSVQRYKTDGALDTDFGSGGTATVDTSAITNGVLNQRVTELSDGKILLVGFYSLTAPPGYYRVFLARLNSDGTIDTTFDGVGTGAATNLCAGNGIVCISWDSPTTYDRPNAVAPTANGGFLLAGVSASDSTHAKFAVAKLTSSGDFDSNFNSGAPVLFEPAGFVNAYPVSIAVGPGGKIVAAGESDAGPGQYTFVRLNSDGSIDNSFDGDGAASYLPRLTGEGGFLNAIVVQADGKIDAVGNALITTDPGHVGGVVMRLNTDGSLDSSFASGGRYEVPHQGGGSTANSIALGPGGRILFGGGHYSTDGIHSLVDVTSLRADGSLDSNFGVGGTGSLSSISAATPVADGLVVQPDGKPVALGQYGSSVSALFRLTAPADPAVPGGGGQSDPIVKISSPAKKSLKASKLKSFAGTAGPAGEIKKVEIALQRKDSKLLKKKKCAWLSSAKAKFKNTSATKGKCTKFRYLAATGTTSWKYALKRALPAGKYVLTARVTLASGRSAEHSYMFRLERTQ